MLYPIAISMGDENTPGAWKSLTLRGAFPPALASAALKVLQQSG